MRKVISSENRFINEANEADLKTDVNMFDDTSPTKQGNEVNSNNTGAGN